MSHHLDHLLLKTLVDDADNWQLEDGTAMGDGLFMAVNRLADTTQLNTKVVILLTDGCAPPASSLRWMLPMRRHS